jgi:four helix bundle protein
MNLKNNSTTKIKDFTDLKTWQESHKLVVLIYKKTESFPAKETFSLIDQMRRAATSITSNIAEGFGRQTYKEKVQFFYLAQGSLIELKNQLIIAKDVDYLLKDDYTQLFNQANEAHQLLQGLIKKSKSFIVHKS